MIATAISLVLCGWAVALAVVVGLGLLAWRALRGALAGVPAVDDVFWIGFALCLALLQLSHIVLPVDWRAGFVLLVVAGLGLGVGRREVGGWLAAAGRRPGLVVAAALAVLWVADLSLAPPTNGDSGLYHFAAVRWVRELALVPGLGNLHDRLAFNSSFFLWVAGLDWGPWQGRGFHLANGLLLLVPAFRSGLGIARVFAGGTIGLRTLFDAMMLFPLAQEIWSVDALASPSPDVPVFVAGIVVTSGLLGALDASDSSAARRFGAAAAATCAAWAGFTIKLSFAAFAVAAAAVAVLAVAMAGLRGPRGGRWVATATLTPLLLVVPWLVRGVVLSGYPFFPSPALGFPVSWRMPRAAVLEQYRWVLSWARRPGAPSDQVLGSWAWFPDWVRSVVSSNHTLMVLVAPLALAAVAGVPAVVLAARSRRGWRVGLQPALALLPAGLSLVYWFLTAPAPRFAGSVPWVLAGGTVALLVMQLDAPRTRRAARPVALASVLLCAAGLGHELWQRGPLVVGAGTDGGFHPPPVAEVRAQPAGGGLVVLLPLRDNQCWDAPLPCSPFPLPGLRLRRPGELGSGFTVERAQAPAAAR